MIGVSVEPCGGSSGAGQDGASQFEWESTRPKSS